MKSSSYIVGVDVGGTYTDVFIVDTQSGEIAVSKVPSTRDDQSQGIIQGINELLKNFSEIDTVVHGTTVGTNALLERKGARTGIITTKGFRDVLEMRRRDRPTTWGLKGSYSPVVDRVDRLEVDERVLADGSVVSAVSEREVLDCAESLHSRGCESVCIFFINGYANEENERVAEQYLRRVWPNSYITRATEILPEIREFERLSTATLNAYLQPVVSSYLDRLDDGLARAGFAGEILIVQSNGGVMAVDAARNFPVRTALSGPAAGVIAGSAIARAAGFDNIITCDMGGTSFDVSLVANGQALLSAQTEIDFGLVVRTPMIEITTIGAGGGSIAWVDSSGMLQVGPSSAGSDPGPVCYGLGNLQPTVTDANLVLGRINPDQPIGGKLASLDIEAAKVAIEHCIARPLGLSVDDAAEAVLSLANARMAGAIRLVSIEQGYDPAEFLAMPFGGGGALHTGALIREVGLKAALVPRYPGVTSALGCVVADMKYDRVQTINRLLEQLDVAKLESELMQVAGELEQQLINAGVACRSTMQQYYLDMLYVGQTHTVTVPLSDFHLAKGSQGIQSAFDTAYKESFGRLLEGIPTRVMNYKVVVIGERPELDMQVFAPVGGKPCEECLFGTRQIYVNGKHYTAGIYHRLDLAVDSVVVGPALLEQPDTTIFIDPGLSGRVDKFGNLVIS